MVPSEKIKSLAWEFPLSKPINCEPQPMKITFKLIRDMLPVFLRNRKWSHDQEKRGIKPFFDLVMSDFPVEPDKGVPLGGLGGGTITRGCRGDFNRWQLKPGDYAYWRVDADQFSLWVSRGDAEPQAVVLNPDPPEDNALQQWEWGLEEEKITYRALFPRAWHDYQEPLPGINLSCRQVSPVIPHNYKESSFPVSTFIWTIENTGKEAADVSVMFTFQNGTGDDNDLAGGHSNHLIKESTRSGEVIGVELRHIYRHPKPLAEGQTLEDQEQYEEKLNFAIGALANRGVEVSYRTRFVTTTSGMDVWGDFVHDGKLEDDLDERLSSLDLSIGGAVCAKVHIPAGKSREVVFALVWDMPVVRFPMGTGWYRRYTKFYGQDGNAAPALLRDALTLYPKWERAIDAWQMPILKDETKPLWYRQMLFNETYYLVDGGTIWTAGREDMQDTNSDPLPEPEIGHFGYLESHEYRMYNTYDVHFSASFALVTLWPELELSLQRDYAKSIDIADDDNVKFLFFGEYGPRKVKGAVPHDLGSPMEDPWLRVNAYNIQDVSRWKDLNPKFVLQIARDYFLTKDKGFLKEVWPAVRQAIQFMSQFDKDGDGMIENEGFPDQTYDVWSANGPSAYSGGLWLACLQAGAALAKVMREVDLAAEYEQTLLCGQQVYEDKLWNGEYYNYEASGSRHQDSIMADQLAGHWYSLACGLGGVIPEEHARLALQKVFDYNVMGFEEGRLGAVNGMRPNGKLDRTGMQSMEIWTGTTFTLAAAMLQAGMKEEAFKTAEGIFHMVYEDYGFWFQTPEALNVNGSARAISYMRPLAIWAMQWELERMSK